MQFNQIIQRVKQRARRFWVHRQSNQEITWMAQQVAQRAPTSTDAPVVFFNASTRLSGMSLNAAYALLAGWSLRLAGAPVVHFVCERGMSRCVLGTNRTDPHLLPPCRECTRQSDVLYTGARVWPFTYQEDPSVAAALDEMKLDELCQLVVEGVPLGSLVLPSARWVLRRYNLRDDAPTRFLLRQYLLSAWGIVQEAGRMLDELHPRAVVVFNGISYPEATLRFVAQRAGVRVITHEVCHQPYTAFFTDGDATAYPINVPDDFELSPAQNEKLDEYLQQRFKGNFSMAGIRFWPEMQSLNPQVLEKVKAFRQVVPIFTNVIFDTSQSHSNVIFGHMFAWLDDLLIIIKAHPDTLFVIRAHPDETRPGKEALESVAGWIKRNHVDSLANVIFVPSQEFISSYELIHLAKFVLAYNSTIGLEAALMGAPVLCAGRSRYTQLPTVFFPSTHEGYMTHLEDFLDTDKVQVPPEFVRNARRFLYYNLYRACLPFGEYIQPDEVWSGYVRLKDFPLQALTPEHSPVLKVILDGILGEQPFLMDE